MRILALLSDGYGASGGMAQYNRDLMKALSQSAHVRSVVALPRFGTASARTPDKVVQLTPQPKRLAWMLKAMQQARAGEFDVVFCGHVYAAPFAAFIARATGARLWMQAHGIDVFVPRSRAIQAALRQARLITCVSRYTRERLLSWSGVRPGRVRVLNNTCSLDVASGPDADDLFKRLGLEGKRVFVTVGRLAAAERYKGQDRVIAALPYVHRTHPEAAYLVVGDGDDRQRLQAFAASLGVSDAVAFAGKLEASALPGILRRADAFVMPSTGEGFGIAFLEAAFAGLPVIGGNRDGSRDALADGAIGALIDPLDQVQLTTAMTDALEGRLKPQREAAARFSSGNFASHVDELVARGFA